MLIVTPAQAQAFAKGQPIEIRCMPAGAAALSLATCIFSLDPTLADVGMSDAVLTPLYGNAWYQKYPPPGDITMTAGYLTLNYHGQDQLGVHTQNHKSAAGMLPYLDAAKPFYAQWTTMISDNDQDHLDAVWLMPKEHDAKHSDQVPGQPVGFEAWEEIDVHEGGFFPGSLSTLHNWSGIYPNYTRVTKDNRTTAPVIDRSLWHTFGVSWDLHTLVYYVDEVAVWSVPAALHPFHYYLITSVASHGKKLPYQMYVKNLSAWI